MPLHREPATSEPARVLLVSQRAARHQPSRTLRFEFEDLVRTFDATNVIAPDRRELPGPLVRRVSALLDRIAPGPVAPLKRDLLDLEGKYDLVLVAVESLQDLLLLRPLRQLLRRGRTSVCLLEEVWAKGLAARTGELRLLRNFDRILVSTAGSVPMVAELTGRPCSYLPPSVDALALCPYPAEPQRSIDVYSMGRRSPTTHSALIDLAERRGWFYLHDTHTACSVIDHREHRRLLGDLLKRTRYFLTYPGKVDAASETGGQQEIGFRYFEGAAAGAVLVGESPATPWFEKLFGWKDAVIHLSYGSADPGAALYPLETDDARQERIRRRNVTESLRRHDHVFRWAEVLHLAGLPETPAMLARRKALGELAESLEGGVVPRVHARGATDGS